MIELNFDAFAISSFDFRLDERLNDCLDVIGTAHASNCAHHVESDWMRESI